MSVICDHYGQNGNLTIITDDRHESGVSALTVYSFRESLKSHLVEPRARWVQIEVIGSKT